MSSLPQRFDALEKDLMADPTRISAYHDLPFAIMHYSPTMEFDIRKDMGLLATRLSNAGKEVHFISVARILWDATEREGGIDELKQEEIGLSFHRAEQTLSSFVTDENFTPLADELSALMGGLTPEKDIVFLVRVGSLAPAISRAAVILEAMHGRSLVPIVLFYPGSLDGTNDLRFMDLPDRYGRGPYNYRVRIY